MGINLRQIMRLGDAYTENSQFFWLKYKRSDQKVIALVSGIAISTLMEHVGGDDLGGGPNGLWREIEAAVMAECKKQGIQIRIEDKEWSK